MIWCHIHTRHMGVALSQRQHTKAVEKKAMYYCCNGWQNPRDNGAKHTQQLRLNRAKQKQLCTPNTEY